MIKVGGTGNTWNAYLDALGTGAYYAQSTTGPVGNYGSATLVPNFQDGGQCQGATVIYLPSASGGGSTNQGAALLMGA